MSALRKVEHRSIPDSTSKEEYPLKILLLASSATKGGQTCPDHKTALPQKPSKARLSALLPKFRRRSDLESVLRSPSMCCLE